MNNNATLYEDQPQQLQKIIAHNKIRQGDPHNKTRHTNVQLLWKNGEQTDTTSCVFGKDTPDDCKRYLILFLQRCSLGYANHVISNIKNNQQNKFRSYCSQQCWKHLISPLSPGPATSNIQWYNANSTIRDDNIKLTYFLDDKDSTNSHEDLPCLVGDDTNSIDNDRSLPPLISPYERESHIGHDIESTYITNYLNDNITSYNNQALTNDTIHHLDQFPQYKKTNPHGSFNRNDPQGTLFDQDTNVALHQNDHVMYYNDRTLVDNGTIADKALIDNGVNTGICCGNSLEHDHDGPNDSYFDTIQIQGNDIIIIHNHITIDESNHDDNLIHDHHVEEEDNLTNNDQSDDDHFINDDNDIFQDDELWQFQEITAHHRVPPDDPQYRDNIYTLRILWHNGELTNESFYSFGKDAPIECAIYTRRHGLLNLPRWQRFQQIHNRNELHHVIVRQAPKIGNLFTIMKLSLMFLMMFRVIFNNITTNTFCYKQINKTQIGGGPIVKRQDEQQDDINYYNTVHASGNRSSVFDNQSHNINIDKGIIITDIIKIHNNSFCDVCIFNNLGTDPYINHNNTTLVDHPGNLNDNDDQIKVNLCHVI